MSRTEDRKWMARALELAKKGEGKTRPNPPVGAVLVRNGKVLGEGYHHRAGAPHAEIEAFKAAGGSVKNATLYVTLEPCSTQGRTPPCTEAIIKSGVQRVVVGVEDPNPRHAGKGLRVLRKHGIKVSVGIGAEEAARLIEPFSLWIHEGRPFVTLKLGLSMDGRIADRKGKSRWITGSVAREWVQNLRRRVDGVMVGGGTVELDNPSLMPRPARGRKPFRIIIDSRGRIPANAQILNDRFVKQTLIFVPADYPLKRIEMIRKKGAEVWISSKEKRRVRIQTLMKELGHRGLLHILCEGGGEIAAALIAARCVDEFLFFIAPQIIGGRDSIPSIGGKGWLLGANPQLDFVKVDRIGMDIAVRAKPVWE